MDTSTADVQLLSAAAAADVAYAGGKGAALARLLQAGLPVPPGCVLGAHALSMVLAAQHLPAVSSPTAAIQAITSGALPAPLLQALQEAMTQLGPAAHGWAVRSSAVAEDSTTASYAGVYESAVAVPAADIWPAVRACWASWWSARAQAYRQHLGVRDSTPQMAVVVQQMVPAQSAGVAFTAEPVRGDRSRMVIHAAPGLGVAVVAGVVQPEQYILAKTPTLRLLETRLLRPDAPPLLAPDVLMALGAMLLRLEAICGAPQDVEWAWDGRRCWIVQSRPITTLAAAPTAYAEDVWSNANLKDVLPGIVSPLTWSLMQPQLEAAMRQQHAEVGYPIPAERPLIRRFWGRPYFNISLFHEAIYTLYGTPAAVQNAQLGGVMPPERPTPPPPSWRQRLRWLGYMLRFAGVAQRSRRAAPGAFAAVQQRWQVEMPQVPRLDRQALLQRLEHYSDEATPFLVLHLHLAWALSGSLSAVQSMAHAMTTPEESHLVADLVTGLGDVQSAAQSYHLWALSRLARTSPVVMGFLAQRQWSTWPQALAGTPFLAAWQTFLATFGHRALYEVELANPRWREQPDYLFEVVATYTSMPQEAPPFAPQAQTQRRLAAERTLCSRVPRWRRAWFRLLVQRSQELSRLRENSKFHLVQLLDLGRLMTLRAADFLVQDGYLAQREEAFLLTATEILAALRGALDAETLRQRITQRVLARRRDAARHLPELFLGEQPLYPDTPAAPGTVLTGLPSSPGRVSGIARVLRSPHDGARLHPGEILVAPSTDPGWTPLFLLAAGLVMETGGYLSHGAIVAREYGIPAVLNVPQATQCIPDGSTILLDGGQGTVQVLASPVPADDIEVPGH